MKKLLETVKTNLQKASKPLFFFDDDPDGLSSFLLLKRACGGKGVVAKSGPILDIDQLRKYEEYNPDLVVILDKAIVSQEFLDAIKCPVVWIDHHPIEKRNNVIYLNPKLWNSEDNRCTTYWVYELVGGPMWLAAVGITADWSIPEFLEEFRQKYPGLITRKPKSPGDLLFNSKLGELIKILVFSLKGPSAEVNKTIDCLTKIEDPKEILEQTTPQGKFIFKRAEKIKKEYDHLLEEAKKQASEEELLVYIYKETKNSHTSFLSNELNYNYPEKFIILGRDKSGQIKISLRSQKHNVLGMTKKALEGVEGYGGGHEHACGGSIKKHDFNKFLKSIKEQLK